MRPQKAAEMTLKSHKILPISGSQVFRSLPIVLSCASEALDGLVLAGRVGGSKPVTDAALAPVEVAVGTCIESETRRGGKGTCLGPAWREGPSEAAVCVE